MLFKRYVQSVLTYTITSSGPKTMQPLRTMGREGTPEQGRAIIAGRYSTKVALIWF